MSAAPTLVVQRIEAGVRPMPLRLPFRFGAHTLTACPQLFVQVEADVAGLGRASGWAAELMVPKWFDKRPAFDAAANVAQLVRSFEQAAAAYQGDAPATAFGLSMRHAEALRAADPGLSALTAGFGPALLDRAVLDALCRAAGRSFFEALQHNLPGMAHADLIDDLRGWDWSGWLAHERPVQCIAARHTVGLVDALEGPDAADGLPASLRGAVERYGHRWFKIKLGGDPAADLARLRAVLALLDRIAPGHRYTLDGNEQYADRAALLQLLDGLATLPAPAYVEQPLPRDRSFEAALPEGRLRWLMDEADGTLDAFVRGRACGWHGVSSKGCKGLYKALINAVRCERWNVEAGRPRHFISAEDLTCQAGLALQQDLALAAQLGLAHCERNGHHFGTGFADAPPAERAAFAQAHPDLYDDGAVPRLRIRYGEITLASLFGPGFAHGADPDFASLRPLADSTRLIEGQT